MPYSHKATAQAGVFIFFDVVSMRIFGGGEFGMVAEKFP